MLNKEKILEALDEEIYVYNPAETKFDEGVLYLANKLKATISLHVFDIDSQSIISQQTAEIEKRAIIHEDYRRTALARIAHQEAEIERQRKYIGFLQSCTRSGESWEGTIDDFTSKLTTIQGVDNT